MSDEQPQRQGPSMVAMTEVLKGPELRVSRLTKGVELPRPVRLVNIVGFVAGAILGLIVALIVAPSASSITWLVVMFGAAGVGAVNYSPLRGESLATWVSLVFRTARRKRIIVGGEQVSVSIGVARIDTPATNDRVVYRQGAVRINPDAYDERGVPISRQNNNLDAATTRRLTAAELSALATAEAEPKAPRRSRRRS